MKNKIAIGYIVLLALFITDIPVVSATLIAEPVNAPNFPNRDRYQTDLFTGAAVYSYPINVPKGTKDLTPLVSLSYNSLSAKDYVAHAGMGWEINSDYVERDVNFTPADTNDDKFKLRFQGRYDELVYVSSEGRYHTKTESNLHITKITTGAANDYSEYWQVITKDGTKYRFGQSTNSELVCNGRSYVGRWNLDLVTDTHDNKIFYTYSESNGASYITKIEYNTEKARIIDFNYAANPYQRQVYTQGCNVTEASRLSNIQVKANSSLVRQYDLAYDTAGNDQTLLQSIIEKGSEGSALPATTFTYKPINKSWQIQEVKWLDHAEVDAHLEMNNVAMADVNDSTLTHPPRALTHPPRDPA